jgi:replicative superfamily II helicase
MITKALFIGVNEYQDLRVDNLEGARPDAIALHALFSDSLPALATALLTDRAATKAAVEDHLQQFLLDADPGDGVLVTFSGHGSASSGLFLHDSNLDDATSTVSMEHLARCFRDTKAERVLILLDCCESGAGPRTILNVLTPGNGLDATIHAAAGGRMMLAAANPVESALESSTVAGHGLLTASLIEVLTRATDSVDVRVVAADIAERVRSEAARLGETQTPVDISIVAGGFHLPVLTPGAAYRQAFPDRTTPAAATSFRDLERFGIPSSIVDVWDRRYPSGLNPLQLEAINAHRLLEPSNLLVVAPTGSGKTLLGELAALRAVAQGRRAVFLVPLRALVAEKYAEFSALYGGDLGLRIIRCAGDATDQVPEYQKGKYDLAILTYEMFLSLGLSSPRSLARIGTVVVDEAHFVTDPERGITVELLFTLLIAGRQRSGSPQIVALSAVIGDVNHFDEWLSARCLAHTTRPVPLVEGVIDRAGVYQFLDVDGSESSTQLVPRFSIQQRGQKESAQDVIVPLVQHLTRDPNETILIFRGTKGEAAGAANYLGNALGRAPATKAIQALPATPSSSDSTRLRQCLERGTAFHNSNLDRQERTVVEEAFRDAREVRVLAATTTLAAGVNTPATTVIIVEHEFSGEEPRAFSVAEYKNMAGRAGRPGFAPQGRAIMYAETSIERQRLFATYVRGRPEGVHSSFDPTKTDTWLIRLLRQVRKIERDKVISLLANTFGGYSLARRDPSWQGRMQLDLAARLSRMVHLGLVEEHRGFMSLTRLGEACGQSSLSLDSCMHLVEILRRHGLVSPLELMLLMQCLDEADNVYTPLARASKTGTGKDRGWNHGLIGVLRPELLSELSRGAGGDGYERRCKRARIVLDWIMGVSMTQIESRFTANPFYAVSLGTVRSIADLTRFHLRAAVDIATVVFDPAPFATEEAKELLERLERGLQKSWLPLARSVPGLTREEVIALGSAGLADLEVLASMPSPTLHQVLGQQARVSMIRVALGLDATASHPPPSPAAPIPPSPEAEPSSPNDHLAEAS